MKELVQKLILWIRERVAVAGGKGVVVGMSGGVDSSVVAVLCRHAFPETTLGVVMPCYSEEVDLRHALLVAHKFDIATEVIVLDKVFDTLLQVLPHKNGDAARQHLAEANLKPRLRMIVLYYMANCLNYLVAGAGNRSELSVGYFTKYGDGGVDILPLGNLVKNQVLQLAIYLGIPEEIINKPPSAGLWRGQLDETEMGLTYAELDHYLVTGEAKKEAKEKIDLMIAKSSHKRCLPPIPPFNF